MRAKEFINEDWNKVNKQDKTDGLSQKAVNAYRRENPGSKLKTAVTTKPSKLKAGSKDAKRRKSFCARMSGNKGPMKKPNGKPTPKALALRRWNCESIEEMQELIQLGEQYISGLKENFADGRNPQDKGDAKRHGINTKASVSSLRKTAKQGGRKGQLAHWLANMKAGRAKHEDIEEGWKEIAAAGALATGLAFGGGAAQAKPLPQKAQTTQVKQAGSKVAPNLKQQAASMNKISPDAQKKIDALTKQANAPSKIATNGLSSNSNAEHTLQKVAIQSGIKGVELAQFMAQARHETADFAHMKEIGGSLDFKKYDPKFAPRKAKILGNTKVGDGAKFKGRGFIQITGRDNYRMAGNAIGIPLEEHPELASDPAVAAKIAVWYWQTRVKPFVNNFDDTAAVTKKINPGMRGLDDRASFFQDYKKIIA